jgi:hypothetical protein
MHIALNWLSTGQQRFSDCGPDTGSSRLQAGSCGTAASTSMRAQLIAIEGELLNDGAGNLNREQALLFECDNWGIARRLRRGS